MLELPVEEELSVERAVTVATVVGEPLPLELPLEEPLAVEEAVSLVCAVHSASSDSKRSARRPKGWVAGPDARPPPPPLTPRAKTGAPSAPKAPHNQMAQRTAQNNRVDEARGSAADGRAGGNDRPAAAHTMPPNKMGRNGNDGGGTILWRFDGCGHEIKLPPPYVPS